MRTNTKNHNRHSGIALIWTAITLIVMILFVGLALDVAKVYLAAHQLQNAADAAALAGARIVRIDQPLARTQAQDIGGLNYTQSDSVILNLNTDNDDPNGDIVIGRYYPSIRSFVPTLPTDNEGTPRPNAVRVAARRTEESHGPIPLIFGPIAHVDDANVSRYAIAIGQGGLGAGLLVLSEDPGEKPAALTFNGNPEVVVIDGSIQVNMPFDTHSNPVNLGGSGVKVSADEFNVVSKTDSTNGYVFDPATGLRVTTDQPKLPDPYRDVPEPAPNPSTPKNGDIVSNPITFEPGNYPNGFGKISSGNNVKFKPGIYIVGHDNKNIGLEITGGHVCARRVMFFISPGAAIKITGGGSDPNITITEINTVAPDSNCNPVPACDCNTITYSQGTAYVAPYKGMSIFQSRTNYNDADVGGGNGLNIQGTLYFPVNHVKLSGGSGSLGIEVIAWTMTIDGTGPGNKKLLISYDGRNRTPANSAYLVW
jgi:hypothetical protein